MIFAFQEDGFPRNVKEGPEGARLEQPLVERRSFSHSCGERGTAGAGWAGNEEMTGGYGIVDSVANP